MQNELSLSPLCVNAQDGSEKALGQFITLSVNHRDGQYEKGERIRVLADLKDADYGNLRMDLLYNGIKKESRELELAKGLPIIIQSCAAGVAGNWCRATPEGFFQFISQSR